MKKYLITYAIPSGAQYEATVHADSLIQAQDIFYQRYFACQIITTESHPVKDSFLKRLFMRLR